MWSKLLKPTWSTLIALGLLLAGLVALFLVTSNLIDRDRAELTERFASERLNQLSGVTAELENDLNTVAQDLPNVGQLVAMATSDAEGERTLRAILEANRAYRAAAVFNAQGNVVLSAWASDVAPAIASRLHSVMVDTGRRSLAGPPEQIQPSVHIEGEPATLYRVFSSQVLPSKAGGSVRAVALVVDTLLFLRKLRVVAQPPESHLLVLGPDGIPLAISSESVRSKFDAAGEADSSLVSLLEVVQGMRDSSRGTSFVGQAEAIQMGLGPGKLIVAYAPIRMNKSPHWSAATLTFTSALGDHEKRVNRHLGLISAGIAVSLLVFGAYVVVTSRRAAVLDERVRHADRLAHLHEKAEKILENIPTGVMVLSEQGVISAMNRALRLKLPFTTTGVTLERAFPRAASGAANRILDLVRKARVKGRTSSLRGERLSLFGEEGRYALHAVPLEPHMSEASLLLVVEDFTAISDLESRLLHAEKLATVGILAAGVAHEVGTPLSVVRGRAEYMLGKLGEAHPQAENLRIIIEQIDRVARIVRELLDFARVERATVAPVALPSMVQRVVDLLQHEATRNQVHLEIKVPQSLPLVAANADQMQQILVNLLMNAFGACKQGGQVSIVAAKGSDEGISSAWDHVRLEIVDDGCGIPSENLHRVFDPFFTTKKRGQGTGLGLTIVGQIVRNHGAVIDLRSEPTKGTTVTLLWPVMKELMQQ